ncbi:hypothetical protein DE146DRAFT_745592 [Phaeosphaeria sp. MPI-PUGE-AT-0046c]|nr:hypothetical protein DE146DRAFT_745592 [Phaeosphaeria sp. MPI-PUGE-AT-0046c]
MPSTPEIDGVRLATYGDLPRMAVVAAAAFFWSPSFRFQRPRHREFPADTISSYWNEYNQAIRDPACVVLVAEDDLDPNEAEHVYDALRRACRSSFPGPRGIVGVCSFTLKKDSCYAPLLQAADHDNSHDRQQINHKARDQCSEALDIYETVTRPPKTKHLADKMRLNTIAVLPRYWRRGHATRLVNFCTQIADLDDALLGVSAAPHGAVVAARAGFEECETVRIKRLAKHEQQAPEEPRDAADVVLWIGIRLPFPDRREMNSLIGVRPWRVCPRYG